MPLLSVFPLPLSVSLLPPCLPPLCLSLERLPPCLSVLASVLSLLLPFLLLLSFFVSQPCLWLERLPPFVFPLPLSSLLSELPLVHHLLLEGMRQKLLGESGSEYPVPSAGVVLVRFALYLGYFDDVLEDENLFGLFW